MHFRDDFDPRPFQGEVINQVLERLRAGADRTIVLAAPGSGKTLAYQSLATRLFREDLITHVAVFVPRVALAEQCETSWMYKTASGEIRGLCLLFDGAKRLGMIRHRVSDPPLTRPSEPGSGFVSTYSALVNNEALYVNWAKMNEGRFLLIADEAQFCGDEGDRDNGGTRAGELIKRLHDYARHTLLLTGTPYRADNQPLILADYEADPTSSKRRTLVHHAEASYADGIAEGYLRTFELHRTDSRVSRRTLGEEDGTGESLLEYNLSDDGSELAPVLRDDKTWKPLVDRVVAAVKDKQVFNRQYRGLISCMGQNDARKVAEYLGANYPGLRVGIAVSSDADAPAALAAFKYQEQDILVTVRMAFIGYDCPQITVVGILTHYRDGGHLMQLVGRGLRVWKELPPREQSCVIVAPDDPKMQGFLDLLRDENDLGMRVIEEREKQDTDPAGAVQEAISFVESAVAQGTRASSNEVDMEVDEVLLVENIKKAVDSAETVTKLKQAIELAGVWLNVEAAKPVPQPRPEPGPPAVFEAPKTERQQIEEIKAKTADAVKSRLYKQGITPDQPGYQEAMTKAMAEVKRASCSADEANTVEKANRRLKAALRLSNST